MKSNYLLHIFADFTLLPLSSHDPKHFCFPTITVGMQVLMDGLDGLDECCMLCCELTEKIYSSILQTTTLKSATHKDLKNSELSNCSLVKC